ncbi:NAD(P)-binding protein [Mycena amicta]|nr:NAD(P)-binding protein [Mycena amicta]
MPSLSMARAFNATHARTYTPVAIFVGGTSGIGEGMAEAFARHTKGNANIILVGRNRAAAESIISGFPKPTADGVKHEFVECDMTLMRNVRRVAGELQSRLAKINFLVLTARVLTIDGRTETEEGIDRKLAVHYYGRSRFIRDLLPSIQSAHASGEDAKVMSVLSAGYGAAIDLDDLGLKKGFTVPKAATSAATYNDIMVNDFAARYPGISFIHSYPGGVRSNLLKASSSRLLRYSQIFTPLLTPFTYSVTDAGEHQLYALLNAAAGPARTDDKGDDIGSKGYYGSPDAMDRLWKHTEEETNR